MNFGDRIKRRREELGLSQEELAKKLGYKSRSAINKIELGINDIGQSKIVALARALNTTTGYLLGDYEAQPVANDLSKSEEQLVKAYRQNPSMQEAVNRILGIKPYKTTAEQLKEDIADELRDSIKSVKSSV